MRFDGLWQHPDFLRLWAAQTVSVFGSLITRTALPFTAILALDASPFQVAALTAAGIVPGLLFGLVAGVWVDRLPRRPILIITDLGRFALLMTVPIAALFDAMTLWQLYAVAFTTGTLTIFFDVAYLSYLPSVVGRDDLLEGNSKLAATTSISEFSAFSISGWLVQLVSGPFAMFIDALTFLVSAAFVRGIKTPEPPAKPADEREPIRTEIQEGVRTLVRDPVLRGLAGLAISFEMAFGIYGAAFLLYVTREVGFDAGVLGVTFGVGGLTSFAGAALAGTAAARFGVGRAMTIGIAVMAVSMLSAPMITSVGLAGLALLVAGQFGDGFFTVYDVNATSLRQAMTPDRILGRVNSAVRFGGIAAALVGTVMGGILGETIGLRETMFIGTGVGAMGALWLALSPASRLRDVPLAPPDLQAGVIDALDAP